MADDNSGKKPKQDPYEVLKRSSELQYNQGQYEMLKRCAQKQDFTEWNRWRKDNPDEKIVLNNADFSGFDFSSNAFVTEDGALNLSRVFFIGTNFEDSHCHSVNFSGAKFSDVSFGGANISRADLTGASIASTNLKNANLYLTKLYGAHIWFCPLHGAAFNGVQTNRKTHIYNCWLDKKTLFSRVNLDTIEIDPGLRVALKDNVRRFRWQRWFNRGKWMTRTAKKCFVQPFWWMTGYGSSTPRIILCFWVASLAFATLYFGLESAGNGVVEGLNGDDISDGLMFLRAMYFSVVTMTTLGFGDLHAEKTSWLGHILLMVQVIIGYVMLGALVTRLGIVFTNDAPAASGTKPKSDKS